MNKHPSTSQPSTRSDIALRNTTASNYAEMRPRLWGAKFRTKALALGAGLIACIIGVTGCAQPPKPTPIAEPIHIIDPDWKMLPIRKVQLVAEAPGVAALDLELLPIPAGSFSMGSPSDESGHIRGETEFRFHEGRFLSVHPETLHRVTLKNPFWLGKYPVTQGQWEAVMGHNPSVFKDVGKDAPVEWVSMHSALEFCRKLNAREGAAGRLPEGYEYSLPTTEEWEWACRAGTMTPFNTGNDLTTTQANYNGSIPYKGKAKGEYRAKTTKVGSFAPNAWGLYDMHGNVAELCWRYGRYSFNFYTSDFYTSNMGSLTPEVRGGAWNSPVWDCRSACRHTAKAVTDGHPCENVGFRLALVPKGL